MDGSLHTKDIVILSHVKERKCVWWARGIVIVCSRAWLLYTRDSPSSGHGHTNNQPSHTNNIHWFILAHAWKICPFEVTLTFHQSTVIQVKECLKRLHIEMNFDLPNMVLCYADNRVICEWPLHSIELVQILEFAQLVWGLLA